MAAASLLINMVPTKKSLHKTRTTSSVKSRTDRRDRNVPVKQSDDPVAVEDFPHSELAVVAAQLYWPNLIPGKEAAPEFKLVGETETPADAAAFEEFLDHHFPRHQKKFATLRAAFDLGPRLSGRLPPPMRKLGFELTPIETYRVIVEQRKFLRGVSSYGNYFAKMMGKRRPPLQICEACGKLFLARRIDAMTCSPNCSAARRMARARARRKQYEQERKKRGAQERKKRGAEM